MFIFGLNPARGLEGKIISDPIIILEVKLIVNPQIYIIINLDRASVYMKMTLVCEVF